MDVKKTGLLAGGFIGSFIVVLVVMFFVYSYLNPEKRQAIEAGKPKTEAVKFDPDLYSPQAVDALHTQIENLQFMIDSLKAAENVHLSQIDSLTALLVKRAKVSPAVQEKRVEKPVARKVNDVSKSLLNLDEETLAPIVNLLDEQQLIGLYNAASSMQQAKLLRSLKPQTAAKILKKVLS